ncbi:MAG: hypothetical protein ACYTFQ_25990 [Planctomycetota bacterium]|jgi:hypothetical protein
MSKKFDPDKPSVKVRGMGAVHYEQGGHKFNSGHKHIGPVKGAAASNEKPPEKREDVLARARAKIGKKKADDKLKDFREGEGPDAVTQAKKEDAAAKAAEEGA